MNLKSIFSISIALCLTFILSYCSEDESNNPTAEQINLCDKVSTVLPEYESETTKFPASKWTESAVQGEVAFQIYRLFADPADDPHSVGDGWGCENIRNNLEKAEIMASTLPYADTGTFDVTVEGNTVSATVGAIQTLGYVITCPFTDDTGETFPNIPAGGITYNYGRTATVAIMSMDMEAAWTTGSIFYLLSGMHMEGTSEDEYNIMEGQYDEATNDLRLNYAMLNPEDSGSTFIFRMELEGNTADYSFEVKIVKRSTGGYAMSLYGKGIASGAGNHCIFKVKSTEDGDLDAAAVEYYGINAEATQSHFESFITDPSSVPNYIQVTDDPSTFTGFCAGSAYISDVEGESLYTEDNLPDDPSNYDWDNILP